MNSWKEIFNRILKPRRLYQIILNLGWCSTKRGVLDAIILPKRSLKFIKSSFVGFISCLLWKCVEYIMNHILVYTLWDGMKDWSVKYVRVRVVLTISLTFNMDPGEKPKFLGVLMQIEEMLIARLDLIYKMMHAWGGQYKYSVHMISFTQYITMITRKLPQHVEQLHFMIIRRCGVGSKYYECYVKIQHVLDALVYKIWMDKYHRDVEINMDYMVSLP